jgi:hypothetical protein
MDCPFEPRTSSRGPSESSSLSSSANDISKVATDVYKPRPYWLPLHWPGPEPSVTDDRELIAAVEATMGAGLEV